MSRLRNAVDSTYQTAIDLWAYEWFRMAPEAQGLSMYGAAYEGDDGYGYVEVPEIHTESNTEAFRALLHRICEEGSYNWRMAYHNQH